MKKTNKKNIKRKELANSQIYRCLAKASSEVALGDAESPYESFSVNPSKV